MIQQEQERNEETTWKFPLFIILATNKIIIIDSDEEPQNDLPDQLMEPPVSIYCFCVQIL